MKTLTQKFWDRVTPSEGCWVWQGGRTSGGYGKIKVNYKHVGAHRISWILHFGDIPEGLWVLHWCDNPPCVRPDHLHLGTAVENNKESGERTRRKSHCQHGHPFDEKNTYVSPNGKRGCRACNNAASLRYYPKRGHRAW